MKKQTTKSKVMPIEKKLTIERFIKQVEKDGGQIFNKEIIKQERLDHAKLQQEFKGLKNSFDMVKTNFEREKNRVDLLTQTLHAISVKK